MKFADTSYLLALLNPHDRWHKAAREWSASLDEPILTTDWILTEVADAMVLGRNREVVASFIRMLRQRSDTEVLPASRDLFDGGLELFADRMDKQWSLTDCISFFVMGKRGLSEALTADHHFEQAGFNVLLKTSPD